MPDAVMINRAPVLALWAAVVAERLGHARAEALSIGRAVSGLAAQRKGRRLALYKEPTEEERAARRERRLPADQLVVLGVPVPVRQTEAGLRAVSGNSFVEPGTVERYLHSKFGDALPDVEAAMRALADSYPPEELDQRGFQLYEEFRPHIPSGQRGWGQKGELHLEIIRSLAKK